MNDLMNTCLRSVLPHKQSQPCTETESRCGAFVTIGRKPLFLVESLVGLCPKCCPVREAYPASQASLSCGGTAGQNRRRQIENRRLRWTASASEPRACWLRDNR